MCVNPLHTQTRIPPQPCVVKEKGIQKGYKWCRNLMAYNIPQPVQNINLVIKNLYNKEITLTTKLDDTIENIKAKIQSEEGTPAEQQRLVFQGKNLEDRKTLEFYIKPSLSNDLAGENIHLLLIKKHNSQEIIAKLSPYSQEIVKKSSIFLRIFLALITCIFIAIKIIARIKKFVNRKQKKFGQIPSPQHLSLPPFHEKGAKTIFAHF